MKGWFDSLISLVKACAAAGDLRLARAAHARVFTAGFARSIPLSNSVVAMYSGCGAVADAREAFDGMPDRGVVSYTAIVTCYSRHGRPHDALELFSEMRRVGVAPNGFTFASVLKAVGALGDGNVCGSVHALSGKYGSVQDVYVGSAIVDAYARCGAMEEARAVLDAFEEKNEVSWNALIAGFARKEDGDGAIGVFREMQRSGFQATHYTYSSVFAACAGSGALEQGRCFHAHMFKSGEDLAGHVGNTALDMYAKLGCMSDARAIFDCLDDKTDIVSWNTMLTALAQHGLAEEAARLFDEMQFLDVQPNKVTFLCLLTACSHGGFVKEGIRYFEMLQESGLPVEIEHHVAVVDLLGRAGLMDHALRSICKMPVRATAAVWGAFLGACRMHKKDELGRFAAERLLELDPCDDGSHMLLCSLYADVGRWSDAASVRKGMRLSGVKKERACSWVEVGGFVHSFVAGDDAHPQIRDIRRKWEEVLRKLKEAGYAPDIAGAASQSNDEGEREQKLQHHSEKLALAFALMTAPAAATIRIMKNIRICGDCHSAFEYASAAMGREIVVRDRSRFHHFSNGSCSCGNYW